MKMLKNRGFAACAMIVLIIAGLFLGTSLSLNRLYNETEIYFYEGEDGFSIALDLEARAAFAGNYLVIAQKYLDPSDSSVKGVKDAVLALQDAESIDEKYDANNLLTLACDELTAKLSTCELQEKDAQYTRSIPADLESRNDTIARDPYNELAAEYNAKREAFPANIFAIGVPKAQYFR